MSEQKRANIVTVGGIQRPTNALSRTIRLCINLSESNEDKYPELNYRELVKAEEQKLKASLAENGKISSGLDPFSDQDDDVAKIAKQFEAKYGTGNLGSRKRCKRDMFADIGAGYDENDSFIDNTDGYDEMVPPDKDTINGGFYINSGLLDFKSIPNKRSYSSSESNEEFSNSSNDSDSNEAKCNGVDENGKKTNINTKPKKKRLRLRLSSDKNTSDDGIAGESVDSHTSDSMSSKPNPTSDNMVTSDSSRDGIGVDVPADVHQIIDEILEAKNEPHIDTLLAKLESNTSRRGATLRAAVWRKVSHSLHISRTTLLRRAREALNNEQCVKKPPSPAAVQKVGPEKQPTEIERTELERNASAEKPIELRTTNSSTENSFKTNPSKEQSNAEDIKAVKPVLNEKETELRIGELTFRLKSIIDELKPSVIQTYKEECDRVTEEKKRLGDAHASRRLPKRRWPWSQQVRQILTTLASLGGETLLTRHILPLFPRGFVRPPTLLRQAGMILKENKKMLKPPSLPTSTVITALPLAKETSPTTSPDKTLTRNILNDQANDNDPKPKLNSIFSAMNIPNMSSIYFDKPKETESDKNFIPPSSIGSITITPVSKHNNPKSVNVIPARSESVLRIKSPSDINDDCKKKIENNEQRNVTSALTITVEEHNKRVPANVSPNNLSPRTKKPDNIFSKCNNPPSPNLPLSPRARAISNHLKDALKSEPHRGDLKILKDQKKCELMNSEAHLPRPELIPKSDIFAKPIKLKDVRKVKNEPIVASVNLDDSSSDLELIEDSKEVFHEYQHKKLSRRVSQELKEKDRINMDKNEKDEVDIDIRKVMQNLKDLHDPQEQNYSSDCNGGVNSTVHSQKV